MTDILSNVLKNRAKFHYKVGYRISFPKTIEAYESMKFEAKTTFVSAFNFKLKSYNKRRLISKCDIFLPTSVDMELTFYPDSKVLCHPLPAGLDPQRIKAHEHTSGDLTHFIYVGTLDKLRQFQTVLDAFLKLETSSWRLSISTYNPAYIQKLLSRYPTIRSNIEVLKADTLDELMEQKKIIQMGHFGQDRILGLERNYAIMAKGLFKVLDSL